MREIFKLVKAAMDQAKRDQDLEHFREISLALGIQEIDEGSPVSIRYCYQLFNQDAAIQGALRSYDQSGPFQNLPDINKIEMVLRQGGEVLERHYVEWED
ncbi:hypothetical protein [Geomonas anaerohicana]|uniref:Uncharacterized protein n=1 Tax=Geomonas anaerohicana TaxID=2798583 RepID=A0ABS0YKM4_9BACT|nr:hypothetical protein [Geomonas anaerohicana]MBJ6752684.1 hypothetical protein [Geomonas anaerohicana]